MCRWRVAALSIRRLCSWGRLFRHCPAGRQAINPGSGIEPNARERQIGLAHFGRMRLARPFDAFFGHGAVMRGRFHWKRPQSPVPGNFAEHCVEDMTA